MRMLAVPVALVLSFSACTRNTNTPLTNAKPGQEKAANSYIDQMVGERLKVSPRQLEQFTLPNQLKVVVISDAQEKKAAVAIRVGVGMYSDPKEYRGLAHYLEHMLFLGSEKYPDADAYQSFSNSVQGESNAFTQGWSTNYYLTVPPSALSEGVDRIAQFFVAPKFDEKYLSKEVNAIQSEYDKNLESLNWRINYLEEQTIDPAHPAHWLFQGNNQTLGKIPRVVMLGFYNRYYSANNMTVTIVGPQSIADLKAMATESFSKVPNRTIRPPVYPDADGFKRQTPRLFLGKTVEQAYKLRLRYNLPMSPSTNWMTKDLDLTAYSLKGSASKLTDIGWADAVSVWYYNGDPTQSEFTVDVDLTAEGYKHWQEIASGVMVMIEDAKNASLRQEIFTDQRRLSELQYLYATSSPSDEAVSINQLLATNPDARTAQARESLLPEMNPAAYKLATSRLTADRLNVFLFAPDIKGDEKTDFYNLEYSERPLSGESWYVHPSRMPQLALTYTSVSPYLPQDLKIITSRDEAPVQIDTNAKTATLLQRDGQFNRPIAKVIVKYLTGPQVKAAAEDTVLAGLYADYLKQALDTWYKVPSSIGFSYDITPGMRGLTLQFGGYSDRIAPIMGEFFTQMKAVTIDPALFARVLDSAKREAANRGVSDAYEQASWIQDLVWNKTSYTDRSLATILDSVTVEKLKDFQARLFQAGRSDILEYGNLTSEQGLQISKLVADSLAAQATDQVKERFAAQAPLGTSSYVVTRPGANNTWVTQFQTGASTAVNVAHARILQALIGSAYYNHMRTEKQYGYIVFGWSIERRPMTGINLLVQSHATSVELSTESHRWLKEDFIKVVKGMPDQDFNSLRANLASSLRLKSSTFEEYVQPLLSSFIAERPWDFEAQIANEVEKTELPVILADLEAMIDPSKHREFSIYLNSTADDAVAPALPAGELVVPSLEDYWKNSGRW